MKSNKLQQISKRINGEKITQAAIFSNSFMYKRRSYTTLRPKKLIDKYATSMNLFIITRDITDIAQQNGYRRKKAICIQVDL